MTRKEFGKLLNLRINLIPEGRSNKSGVNMTPTFITIHNTENRRPGANATAHVNFLSNVGFYWLEKKNGRKIKNWVSWHYTVDDAIIVKHLNTTEKAWHAGSNANNKSIAIEICMNQGIDQSAAFERAAKLVAVLMYDLNIPIENVVTHNYWTGKKCPVLLMENDDTFGTKWNRFKAEVKKYFEQIN